MVRPLLIFFVPPTLDFLTRLGDVGFLIAGGLGGSYVVSENSSLTLTLEFLDAVPQDLTTVDFAPPIRLGIFPVAASLRRTESFFAVARGPPTVDLKERPTEDLGRPRGFLPRVALTVSSDEVVYSPISSKQKDAAVSSRLMERS